MASAGCRRRWQWWPSQILLAAEVVPTRITLPQQHVGAAPTLRPLRPPRKHRRTRLTGRDHVPEPPRRRKHADPAVVDELVDTLLRYAQEFGSLTDSDPAVLPRPPI